MPFMEKEIVEEEIDLREYLEVLWKNKPLILAIVLVSLISAGYYSFFVLQDEYSSEAKLSYISNSKISLSGAVELLKFQSIVQKTVQEGEISNSQALSVLKNLKIENIKNTNDIQIKLTGNEPETMTKYFDKYIDTSVGELNKKSLEKSQVEYSRLENLSILYTKQRAEIIAKINRKLAEEAELEIRRLENLSGVAAKFGNRDKQIELEFKISDLESIKEGRVSSSVAQQIILFDPDLNLLNSQLTSINDKLVDLENKKLELGSLDSPVVELITPPTNPSMIGPKRGLNMAIAAVLGLFIGVFAAFFKNYLEESASR